MVPHRFRQQRSANAALAHGSSDEFSKIMRAESLDEPLLRVLFHWCGNVQSIVQRELPKGIGSLFRACIEPFLKEEGYEIHGITGAEDDAQSPPLFESITIAGESHRIPKEAIYFVREKSSSATYAVGFKEGMPASDMTILVNGPRADLLLRDLEAFVKKRNYLRKNRFTLDGTFLDHIENIQLDEVILTTEQRLVVDRHILGFTNNLNTLATMGGRTQRGILLEGPPGNGKSHLVKALVNEILDFSVCVATPSDFANSQGVEALRMLVEYTAPILVIVEEIDIIGEDRSSSHFAAPGMATWMQMLDGLLSIDGVLTIATTNRPEMVEQALAMRPGRFDRRLQFSPLPEQERAQLIQLLAKPLGLTAEARDYLCQNTEGLSGAQIKEILQSSRLIMIELRDNDQPDNEISLDVVQSALTDCHYKQTKTAGFASLGPASHHAAR